MKPKAFAQPAWISFQGDRVFRLLQHNPDSAHFEVIGFENQVQILDYRPGTLNTLEKILAQQQDVSTFPAAFNTPALVDIEDLQASTLKITLTETSNPYPLYMLWAVIGLDDGVPIFDYVATRYAPLDKTQIAFFSLYKRPQPSQQIMAFKHTAKYYLPSNDSPWLTTSVG